MDNETQRRRISVLPASILVSATILAGAWIYTSEPPAERVELAEEATRMTHEEEVVLPVVWGDLGAKLVSVGAIDREKFLALYSGTDRELARRFLDEKKDTPLSITTDNAGILLNFLWALGLASKNPILDSGEMSDPKYGGAENFASTAGWTIAKGDAMEHYSRHLFFPLTSEQQALVDKVSRGIYRPCCDNSTHFPDCNHGMAMLGLLELMASQGVNEHDMRQAALAVNSYWFPDAYQSVAGCGVDAGAPATIPRPQSGGCGV